MRMRRKDFLELENSRKFVRNNLNHCVVEALLATLMHVRNNSVRIFLTVV